MMRLAVGLKFSQITVYVCDVCRVFLKFQFINWVEGATFPITEGCQSIFIPKSSGKRVRGRDSCDIN